jgi:hypothetical protein
MRMATLRPRAFSWHQLHWPHEVTAKQLEAALRALSGTSTPRRRHCLTLLAVGRAGRVEHYVAAPASHGLGLPRQLAAVIPGIALEPINGSPEVGVDRAWRCWASSRVLPLDTKHPDTIAGGIIAALSTPGRHELLVLRWTLGRVLRPATPQVARGWRSEIAAALGKEVADLVAGGSPDGLPPAALAHKRAAPGWSACLDLGVRAHGRRRQRQLLGHLSGALRVAQAPGVQLGFRPTRTAPVAQLGVPARRNLRMNVDELAGLAGWPIGITARLPVLGQTSRLLEHPARPPRSARVIAEGTYPGGEAPLVLSARDALQHLHVIGPTGTGKSTLLLNLITQDMATGRSVVVIEPRGDLISDVLARVPDDRLDDVVVVDPTDPAPVGINPLAVRGMPGDLKAEHILTVFKSIYADSWGPRTQDILTAGLLTLTQTPAMSLAAFPLLFTNETFRRRLVANVDDPLALDMFWQWFEDLSAAERADALAPVMNKLRSFLLRKALRRIIGQPQPALDLRDIYRKRTILLVNLATGEMGPEASALLGAMVVSALWQTVLGRTAVPAERRHPVMVFLDEFQSYLALPTDLADVLAQARGLGVGLTLAHQHLAQLPSPIKAATLANARSRVVFASQHDDAQVFVRDDARLTPADVRGLDRYSVYASLLADNRTTPYASGQTLPAPPVVRDGDEVRERSRRRWGIPAAAIDAELEALIDDGSRGPAPSAPANGRAFVITDRPESG